MPFYSLYVGQRNLKLNSKLRYVDNSVNLSFIYSAVGLFDFSVFQIWYLNRIGLTQAPKVEAKTIFNEEIGVLCKSFRVEFSNG
jgi:hypothetical protein